ncbi:MAG: hypothetical protein JEZ07_16635 [Phycisphaerae bacterium]|nr:hypothetical protein [Phycisphaerae bacterium]
MKNDYHNYKFTACIIMLLALVGCGSKAQIHQICLPFYMQNLARIENTYGIKFSYNNFDKPSWDSLKCDDLTETDMSRLKEYITLFSSEFSKYPPAFVVKTYLKQICFCKNLEVGRQYRAVIPDYYTETLYYDIYRGHTQNGYHADVIHHEYYHMIEQQLNGDAYYKDPGWAKLNAPDFKYGSGGAAAQGVVNVGVYNHPTQGFASLYAATGLEEDKAVIFACLMVAKNHKKIMQWSQKDTILAAKIKYMKDFLNQICPAINDDFWGELSDKNFGG